MLTNLKPVNRRPGVSVLGAEGGGGGMGSKTSYGG
jgi:hypothetical protein